MLLGMCNFLCLIMELQLLHPGVTLHILVISLYGCEDYFILAYYFFQFH